MIMKDAVTSYLITLSKFCTKKGADINTNQELVQAINTLTEENSLATIYVNDRDNINIPDVCVIPLFDRGFAGYLLNPDSTVLCPFGYTIEIHARCFAKYSDEELGAVIIHDILQNVMSDTAKIRMLKAYTTVAGKHQNQTMLQLFDDINLDEVLYIAFAEICMRPFRVPTVGTDYVSTDDVLEAIGLADAYDSYVNKVMPLTTTSIEDQMARELRDDVRDVNTVINACLDNDIRHYYAAIRKGVPLLTFENVLGNHHGTLSIGFTPKGKHIPWRNTPPKPEVMSESFNSPESDYDIRFQIDKIIGNMRYAESEAEREVVLFKIKQLSIKLTKLEMKLSRIPNPNKVTQNRLKFLAECKAELEELRRKTVAMEIKEKRWHVYAKGDMPDGYDF
ncbi:MAG: hypothetical protein NC114_06425 [Ruminococcus flavefaciens]|nr:hypothetical protein [Ruminococcus flavefaciens]